MLIWLADVNTKGAGTPSNDTTVPANWVWTTLFTIESVAAVSDPRDLPNIVMISPGATLPERKLAALVMPAALKTGAWRSPTPACAIVKTCPAIDNVPLRAAPPSAAGRNVSSTDPVKPPDGARYSQPFAE